MKQLTTEEAIKFADSQVWETWNHEQIVKLQLYQKKLCVPFDRFHEATKAVLGRPVYTHEFVDQQRLIDEYEGERPRPTFEEILDLIPKDRKLIFVVVDEE